jgi:PD-(D/E)XK nuclease superfamily protein
MVNPNLKGAIAEQAIAFEATKLGVPVWLPAAEHGRVDMLFEVGGRFWRVQCKSGRLSPTRDVVIVPLFSCRRGPNGHIRTGYGADEIDLVAVYAQELDRCFLMPVSLTEELSTIHLRLTPPRNGQVACINLAEDFDFVGAIAQLGERCHGMAEVAGSSPASSTSSSDTSATVGSNPFRDKLGYWMEQVAAGREVLVTFRGKPRVRLTPVARPL